MDESEGFAECVVVSDGLVEVGGGAGDEADGLVSGDGEESEEESELSGVDVVGRVGGCGEDDGVVIDVEGAAQGGAGGWVWGGEGELVGEGFVESGGSAALGPGVVVVLGEGAEDGDVGGEGEECFGVGGDELDGGFEGGGEVGELVGVADDAIEGFGARQDHALREDGLGKGGCDVEVGDQSEGLRGAFGGLVPDGDELGVVGSGGGVSREEGGDESAGRSGGAGLERGWRDEVEGGGVGVGGAGDHRR